MQINQSPTTLEDVELVRPAITPMLGIIHAEQELLKVRSPAVSDRKISRNAMNAPALGICDTELAFRPTYRLLPPSPSR
ncbi:MAG: hypothetical protein CBARDCOR_3890 [uncultured Caballeronia sp.]|nr:MAG: hypothetical protein CBARDCOR_3890 [uncultured Caballeronia sp.]